jgi:hypothetical protein
MRSLLARRWPRVRIPATRNMDEFRWISEIKWLNPLAERA